MKTSAHRNWKLVRASWMFLLRHRMLLVYPLLSTIAVSFIVGYLPLALVRARIAEEEAALAPTPQGVIGFLILYFTICIVVQFVNVMLVADAVARIDGRYRFRLRGWRVAVPRIPGIATYAVLTSTVVSIILGVIRIVAGMVGIHSLPPLPATFLGVPVITAEGLGALPAMARSESLLRATWGNQFVGGTGVRVVRVGLVALVFTSGVALILLVSQIDYDPLTLAIVVGWLVTFLFLITTGGAVSTIYATATYRHCIGQPVPGFEALDDIPGEVLFDDMPKETLNPETVSS